MNSMNANPIKIQVMDINHHNITNAKVKVIAPNGDILFNEKSQSGEIILDDIQKLKNIHRFKVEIEHPHYKSTPKTLASCIRESCKDRFHILEFPYQDKLLVSSIYAEIKEIESKESKTPQQKTTHITTQIQYACQHAHIMLIQIQQQTKKPQNL